MLYYITMKRYKVLGKWVDVTFADGGVWADVGSILEHDGEDIFVIGKDNKPHRTINSDAWLALMIERGDVQEL